MSNNPNGNGPEQQIPEPPPSIHTTLIVSGQNYWLDDDPEDVARTIDACISGARGYVEFRANRKPIYFSKAFLSPGPNWLGWQAAFPVLRREKEIHVPNKAETALVDEATRRR